jgi:hypothetical protein
MIIIGLVLFIVLLVVGIRRDRKNKKDGIKEVWYPPLLR